MTEPPINSYLWDPTSPPAEDIARIEEALAPLASNSRRLRALPAPRLALAAAIALLLLPGLLLLAWPRAAGWRYEITSGSASMSGGPPTGLLRPGAVLETDPDASAALRMPGVGTVLVSPGSRIRVARVARDEHRLALDRGQIVATITAPPRLFFVDTPSAEAIDLGCVYTLRTDETGVGLLDVAVGFVALQRDGREVFVPAGASCPLSASGPGIPRFTDAPADLAAALDLIDSPEGAGFDAALAAALASARVRDTLSLLHLIPRLEADARRSVIERANALVPIPEGDRAGVELADPDALISWRLQMQRAW